MIQKGRKRLNSWLVGIPDGWIRLRETAGERTALPPGDSSWFQRLSVGKAEWGLAVLLGLGFYFLYASLLPNYPTRANHGSDGGEFLAALLTGGVPHPSGYPFYTLLGRLFLLLPLSTPYYRVAMLSALTAALAAALAFVWVRRRAGGQPIRLAWLAAAATALAWGSSPLLWSQAVIVEVYALHALVVMVWLFWISALLDWQDHSKRAILLVCLAWGAGLSLGNHLSIVFMLPLVLWGQIIALRRGLRPGLLVWQGLLFFSGALIYLLLPWQARGWPPINWGNPQTWQGFWWLITAGPYHSFVSSPLNEQWLARLWLLGQQMVVQFGVVGCWLALVGLIKSPGLGWRPRLMMVWLFGVYHLFTFAYQSQDALVYLIPAYLAVAVWLGQGLWTIGMLGWRGWPVGRVLAAAALMLLTARMVITRASVDPRQDTVQADFAHRLLSQAPDNAFVLTSGDEDSFPIWYEHFGLKRRPDLRVITLPLTQYGWYQETVQHTYDDLRLPIFGERGDASWADQLVSLNPARPVCRTFVGGSASQPLDFRCEGASQP